MGHVRGYRRRDGTYVRPHYRRDPVSGGGLGFLATLGTIAFWIIAVGVIIAIVSHVS